MGIPSYFSQLRRRYGKHLDTWLVSALPDETPCAQLYVDLNGILHIAAHKVIQRFEDEYLAKREPSGNSLAAVEAEMEANREMLLRDQLHPRLFQEVVEAIQRLLDTARPTQLCYLAIDGVAPRAKMVQQRQRRYRAVEDKAQEHALYTKHHKPYVRGLLWDSNCVTPGTTFMQALEVYLHAHLQTDLTKPHTTTHIVLSDATEPGEGEHKIMDTLRAQGLGPNEAAVIYGQDADLLMLAFAYRASNPETPVFILRERDVMPTKRPVTKGRAAAEEVRTRVRTVMQSEAEAKGAPDKTPETDTVEDAATEANTVSDTHGGEGTAEASPTTAEVSSDTATMDTSPPVAPLRVGTNASLQYVHIAVLETQIIRHLELYGDLYAPEDRPRVMRDYVALCFLLGNDFLPHGPSLAIPANGLDVLFEAYVPMRKTLQRWLTYGYATPSSDEAECAPAQTHLDHAFLAQLVQQLSHQEDYLSAKVYEHTMQKRKWSLQQERYPRDQGYGKSQQHLHHTERIHTFQHESRFLQALPPGEWASDDVVAPGAPGWQRRYYQEVERVRNMDDIHQMCRMYLEGMFWTLQYYCHGCWSTEWQYPYVSSPLLSNLASYLMRPRCNVNRLVKRAPFVFCDAMEQLKTVLPPTSFDRCVPNGGSCKTGMCGELVAFGKRYRWECPVRVVAGV